ncbi:MAG TPA: saccharopine dehydrogenase NADP-binding domain-containing protein [Kofleriaceae bacterium]|nr:saccharopine dehydrogenase NADP-binding domain-containing protein [Kofleriaceae bacterium]
MIVVYGATGTTGSLVAEELYRRGFDLVLAGRDRGRLSDLAEKLGGLRIRLAQVHDAGGMATAVDGADVVVACAGPYLVVGEPVLRAAVAAGAHYLDVAGEQAFIRAMYEQYDSRARKAGVTAVCGFGVEVALGDWAAARAAALVRAAAAVEDEPIDEVAVAYALSGFRPSGGTVQSAVATLARPAVVWQEDRWEPVPPAARARTFAFPPPFGLREAVPVPAGEVVTVPRHVAARRVEGFLAVATSPLARYAARAAGLAAPLVPLLAASPLGALVRARAGAAPPPDAEARRQARFAVVAEASHRFHRSRVSLSGGDLYGVSAVIAAEGVARLSAAGSRPPAGVSAPSELIDPAEALAELVGEGHIAMEEA